MNKLFIIPFLFISVTSFASETIKSLEVKLNQGDFISTQKIDLNNNHAEFSFLGRMYDIDVIQSDPSDTSARPAFATISVQRITSVQFFRSENGDELEIPQGVDKFVTRVSFKNKKSIPVESFGVTAEFKPVY